MPDALTEILQTLDGFRSYAFILRGCADRAFVLAHECEPRG